MIVSSTVPRHLKARNILDYLAERFSYLSVESWRERIEEGRILCNQGVCTITLQVHGGDIISYDMPDFDEPPADLNYRIVYEDEWILGIDKPGNLAVHRTGRSFRSNLIYQLRYVHAPAYPDAQIVNRLDRETSGVVLVARTAQVCADLHREFSERRVAKEYLAIVHGIPAQPEATIDFPIGKDDTSAVSYRFVVNGKNAKAAQTHVTRLETVGTGFSLLAVKPITGRTHQIRVHLQAIGHGIVGDKLYGMDDATFLQWREHPEKFRDRLLFERQALHCRAVTFRHPVTGRECRIEAAVPADMQQLLQKLAAGGAACSPEAQGT
jgi:RluA family pseudouridine synthase